MNRGLWPCVLLVAACSSAVAPSGFGVNLRVRVGLLPPSTVASIVEVRIAVSGESQPYSKTLDVGGALGGGELRIHYVPGVHAGQLQFDVVALTATGDVAAHGSSGEVTIVDNHAVEAIVTLFAGEPPDLAADLSAPDLGPVPPDLAVADLESEDLATEDLTSQSFDALVDHAVPSDQAVLLDQVVLLTCGDLIQCTNYVSGGGQCPDADTMQQCVDLCAPRARPSSQALLTDLLVCITAQCGQPDAANFTTCELHVQCNGMAGMDFPGCEGQPKGACNNDLTACMNDS